MSKLRKSGLLLTFILLLVSVVTACGSKNNNASSGASLSASESASASASASQTASAPASSDDGATTKKVTDGMGREIEVPVKAQRVVALNNFGDLLALGVKPVGTINYYLDKYKDEPEAVAGIESVGDQEADNEKVLAATPDLIIVSNYFKPEVVDALQKIAPTYATTFGRTPYEQLDDLAALLDVEAQKQAFLDSFKAEAADAKEKLKGKIAAGEKVGILQFWSKKIYEHQTKVFTPLYEDIGFLPTEHVKTLTATTEVTQEAVPTNVADADRLFIMVDGQADIDTYNSLKESAWKNIPAVQKKPGVPRGQRTLERFQRRCAAMAAARCR
ncbi:ABC transporter substrate-binding protein [Cohnella rhizosphaerae]|uniref:ABC transporter substrate-binding protein n=1 Tax=Cohnella rhizosphaerae TaxID=1457232 RepID=A0A9X4L153_9BACL|nr:ABC transporter substrate-binding protein [Cohnella rhizosphaerae]MDG0811597.1 ABC transporter substrate-binding protein [Cohnella rhizosphaerae]